MTTWAAVACAALLLVFVGLAHLGAAVLSRHRAQAAADLSALAAAGALRDGADGDAACAAGRDFAARNGARPVACRELGGGDVYMEVVVPVLTANASGQARAGPAEVFPGLEAERR